MNALDFARSTVPARFEVGGAEYAVRPPCVAEALVLMAALDLCTSPDGDAYPNTARDAPGGQDLYLACADWLPQRVLGALFGPDTAIAHTASEIGRLLGAFVPPLPKPKGEPSGDPDWAEAMADLANATSTSLTDVLALPWGLFVALSRHAQRLQALRQADVMIGYATARTGGDGWKRLMDRAGMVPKPKAPAWVPSEEWTEAQKAKARAYQMRHGKRGEA